MMKLFYPLFLSFILAGMVNAQNSDFTPDMSRALFHQRLDQAQLNLFKRAANNRDSVQVSKDPEINLQLTYQITSRINQLQKTIEQDSKLSGNIKVGYIRGLNDLITQFETDLQSKRMNWLDFPDLISAFEESIFLNNQEKSIFKAVQHRRFQVGSLITRNVAFFSNHDLKAVKQFMFLKYVDEYPQFLLRELGKDSDYSFTDSLIQVAARKLPEELFSYAQARNTVLGRKIAKVASQDSLVQLIVELSGKNSGQMYFPFLDGISRGEITKQEVAKALEDSSAYYTLLVKTQVTQSLRISKGETIIASRGLESMLRQKSRDLYVNTINGLHDSPNAIRYRSIQKLNPQELYYLVVLNESEIYTSSYVYVYHRIFEVMRSNNSDSLLQLVNFDKYKKFLTMASNYNTLDNFLARMSMEQATTLMTSFVSNLDKGKSIDDIEDAVDVANAYASISKPDIKALMLNQVRKNLEMAKMDNNQKGSVIYHIEKLIMESNDSIGVMNLTDSLGIPPVYEVKNPYLRDSLGRIVMQMYFYGDGGGKGSFNYLMGLYSDRKKWALESTGEWVKFTSINTPVPFVLFANRALDEEKDLDEKAQLSLIKWMGENGYNPSLTVHRGHSYFLKYTVQKMLPSSKVVVLGSCGAYQNLSDILEISPDAYIISSKQVGYGEINIALFSYLIEKLKMGKDIQWPGMMTDVAKGISAAKQEGYEDYVFPHKNLGALFIKAYKIAMQAGDEVQGYSKN